VEGKTGKEDDWWGGAYGMEKIASYNVERSSGSILYSSALSMTSMISLVVTGVLLARQ
jgi:hypothetical protein